MEFLPTRAQKFQFLVTFIDKQTLNWTSCGCPVDGARIRAVAAEVAIVSDDSRRDFSPEARNLILKPGSLMDGQRKGFYNDKSHLSWHREFSRHRRD